MHWEHCPVNAIRNRATRWSAVERRMTESTGITSDAGAKEGSEGRRHRVRYDIEGLRALAVLSVLIYHAFPKRSRRVSRVRHFLCISGYLIGRTYSKTFQAGHLSILRFYAKRARRIFPALALVLICIWGAGWAFFTASEFAALGRHMVAAVFSQTISCFGRKAGTSTPTAIDKPLLHLWSLALKSNSIWSSCDAVAGAKRHSGSIRWWRAWAVVALLSTIILSGFDYAGSFYLLHTRFWELAAGVYTGPSRVANASTCAAAGGNSTFFEARCPLNPAAFPRDRVFALFSRGSEGPQGEWNTVVSDGASL